MTPTPSCTELYMWRGRGGRAWRGRWYTGAPRGSGGIGRRASLRSWWPKGRRGSSPFFRRLFSPISGRVSFAGFLDLEKALARRPGASATERQNELCARPAVGRPNAKLAPYAHILGPVGWTLRLLLGSGREAAAFKFARLGNPSGRRLRFFRRVDSHILRLEKTCATQGQGTRLA